MSTTTIPRSKTKRPPAFAITSLPMKTFTVNAYHRLIESGALTTSDRMELLNGLLVYKMPQNAPHASTILKLEELLWRRLPKGLIPWSQKPITLTDLQSEPEPDIAIVPGPSSRYESRKPTANDISLIIEVSDTTLALDSGEKKETYAAAGIPEYWIINLPHRRVEVYSAPKSGRQPDYRTVLHYRHGHLIPLAFGDVVVEPIVVAELLPASPRRSR